LLDTLAALRRQKVLERMKKIELDQKSLLSALRKPEYYVSDSRSPKEQLLDRIQVLRALAAGFGIMP
jgi:hypothetical protein